MPDTTYADALARFEAAVAEFPDIAVKGKVNRYTALGGNMFGFLDKTGALCLRLGKPGQAAFWREHGGGPVLQHGSMMRGYVEIPEALAADPAALSACFAASLAHVRTLPVKPTTRG